MSSDTIYTAVHDYLSLQWTSTPIAWENEAFTPPIANDGSPMPFLIVEIEGTGYDQMSIGSGGSATELWRESGTVFGHVLVPAGTGSTVARQLATAFITLLRGLRLPPNVRFQSMSIGAGQTGSENGALWGMTAWADWIRD